MDCRRPFLIQIFVLVKKYDLEMAEPAPCFANQLLAGGTSIDPKSNNNRHLRADQSPDGAIGCFALAILNRRTERVLRCGEGARKRAFVPDLRAFLFSCESGVKSLQSEIYAFVVPVFITMIPNNEPLYAEQLRLRKTFVAFLNSCCTELRSSGHCGN